MGAILGLAFAGSAIATNEQVGVRVLPPIQVTAPVATLPVWHATSPRGTLLVIGTVWPVPAGLDWHPYELDPVIRRASAILLPPDAFLVLGFRARAALSMALLRQKLPEGTSLRDQLGPADYQAIVEANRSFRNGDPALFNYTPHRAEMELQAAAMKALKLEVESPVWAYLKSKARHFGVPVIHSRLRLDVKDPLSYARSFDGLRAEDRHCLVLMARLLATHPEAIRKRARVWADGAVPAGNMVPEAFRACHDSLHPKALLASHGVGDLGKRWRKQWLSDLASAFTRGRLVVTIAPVSTVRRYLQLLRERGFRLSGPELPPVETGGVEGLSGSLPAAARW